MSLTSTPLDTSIAALQRTLECLELDDAQRNRLEMFLCQKEKVGKTLNLKHFQDMGELGAGNGGVVSRMFHKPTGLMMARKVRELKSLSICQI